MTTQQRLELATLAPGAELELEQCPELLQLVRLVGAELRAVRIETAIGGFRITCQRARGEPLIVIMPTLATAARQALEDL